jgi:hypothetical protein
VGDGADGPVRGQFERPLGDRMEEVVEPLQHGHTCRRSRLGDGPRLRGVTGEGLFAQHGLSRRDRREIPRRVQRVGQRVVNDVDLRIVDDVLITVENPLNAVLLGELLGPRPISCRHGHQAVAEFGRGTDDRLFRDPRRPEDADAQIHVATFLR